MTSVVAVWTGREVRALRDARRMSLREFARHLGVSDRMISKWEAGGAAIQPRPVNQEALDSSLAACSPQEQARFALLLADPAARPPALTGHAPRAADPDPGTVRHPGDGKAMVRIDAGVFLCGPEDESVWLNTFYIDIHPTTNADYGRFIAATGYCPPPHWVERTYPDRLASHPVVFVTWHDARAYADWALSWRPRRPKDTWKPASYPGMPPNCSTRAKRDHSRRIRRWPPSGGCGAGQLGPPQNAEEPRQNGGAPPICTGVQVCGM